MDPIQIAYLDKELRAAALGHATHDCRGNEPADTVVRRAQAYYEFLMLALPKASAHSLTVV